MECLRLRPVPASQPHARRRNAGEEVVQPQSVLMQNERRLEPREDIVELVAVHLDVNGADGRAIAHDAEIAQQMLDRVVGKQRHPVIGPDAAAVQERGDPAGRVAELAISDAAPVVGGDEPRLLRMALRSSGDPAAQQLRTWLDRHRASRIDGDCLAI